MRLSSFAVDSERALNWAQAERERAAVVQMGADLAAVGIDIVVFKGVHLAYAIAPSPDFRLCLDADVIVLGDRFEEAAARLRALAHWSVNDANWSTYGATLISSSAYVDMHRMPLPPRFGRFDVQAMAKRARRAEAAFGPHVLMPDPIDAACLAIAHHVKDMLGVIGHGKLASDLALIRAAPEGLLPEPLAERLRDHGLRRAGLLAFLDLADTDSQWAAYRDALAESSFELRALRAMSRAVVALSLRSERLGFVAVRALADRPIDGVTSAALAAARLTRDLLRR